MEIDKYSAKLANKKQIVIANKMDLPSAKENLERFKEKFPELEVFEISAINNIGVEELMNKIADILDNMTDTEMYAEEELESHVIYKFKNEKPYTIRRDNDVWIIEGDEIEKLFKMTKFTEDESVARFARKLKGMGIDDALESMGAKRGDEVKINDFIFIFKD